MRALAAALLLIAAPALAEEPGSTARAVEPGTVTTSATARDRLPNTVADVGLGVEARGRSVAEVQAALSAGSARLSAYLRSTAAERTRTQSVQVEPEVEPNPPRGQAARILGYSGHLTVEFRIDAGALGDVLSGALGQGANSIEQATLRPREAELDAARNRLAAAATRIALDQARAVAEAAGRRVGAIRAIAVNGAGQPVPSRPMMARAAGPVPPPPPMMTEAGDTEVTATVTLTQALIEP